MMMRSCLMIMNARDIPECLLSLKALKIDKVYFRGFTEKELESKIIEFIGTSWYDRYILVSDDVIVTQQALDNLLEFQSAGPVVTGWCNIFAGETIANLELNPISQNRGSVYFMVRDILPRSMVPLIKRLYHNAGIKWLMNRALYNHFPTLDEIWSKDPVFRTYFVGWSLTSISREYWLKYGFHYSNVQKSGHGSDQKMSLDLAADNVVMLCARDSFIYHLGTVRKFVVGKVKQEVIFEGDAGMRKGPEYASDYISI